MNFEENDSFKKVCNDGSNPCQLDQSGLSHAYFLPINGYYCLDGFDGEIICTCPDNSTRRNRPCRKIWFEIEIEIILIKKKGICDQHPNPCGDGPSVVTCTDINKSFSCLCNNGQGELIVSTKPCGLYFIHIDFQKCHLFR